MKLSLIAALAVVAAFGATTWWVLESGGVAVVETRTPEGGVRSTHVWYVEPGDELWLEAGTPTNGWFLDVQENPGIALRIGDHTERYVARPVADASSRDRIRSGIREKYGLRDRWIGLIIDTSRSVPVQLLPAED